MSNAAIHRLAGRVIVATLALALQGPPARGGGGDPVPIAIVTRPVPGTTVLRAGQRRALSALELLAPGDVLQLDRPGALEVAMLDGDGRVYTLAGPGGFRLDQGVIEALAGSRPPAWRQLDAVWRDLRIDPSRLARASMSLRGTQSEPLELVQPRGLERGERVALLLWRAPPSATGAAWEYDVRISDAAGRALFENRTRGTSMPVGGVALERGRPYVWTVEARSDDGEQVASLARFEWCDLAREQRVAAFARAQAAPGPRPAGAPPDAEAVLLALALAQEGLREESDAMLRAFGWSHWPVPRGAGIAAAGPSHAP